MERWIESESFLPAACSKVTSVVCRIAVLCIFGFLGVLGRPAPGDIIPIQWTVRALLTASHKMSLLIRIIEVKSLSHCSVVVSSLQQTQAQTWVGCFSLCLWSKTFNSIQVYLYNAFYDTIVAKQLYRKLSLYNIFIYCRNLICLTYDEIW